MMSNLERLAYMANQIARAFESTGHDSAVAATADHIASFWDPRMRGQGIELARSGEGGLSPVAAAALTMLAEQGAPPSQTRATDFAAVNEAGHADAG
ncbi:MAG: formate dehydrogenase subunit delta [Sphingomonas fennica]